MKPNQPRPQQSVPLPSSAWAYGIHQGAGIYFLDGACHVAAHESPMEAALAERGALLIAVLRFEPEPLDGVRPGHRVQAVGSGRAAARFAADRSPN
jgi:hypothetical protein